MSETANSPARNVFGEPLVPCSFEPMTGYFRDGCCRTNDEDTGTHVICSIVNEQFLTFSKARGNDLSTARPEMRFRGLQPGDQWCLCALRWKEAYQSGVAPLVVLESTSQRALSIIPIEVLQQFDHRRPSET